MCDLLPEAIPSLVFNLQTMQYGPLNEQKKNEITNRLGCTGKIPWDSPPFYTAPFSCTFPGHEVYEAVIPLSFLIKLLQTNMEFAEKYMTPLNLNYNYIHKQRAIESLEKIMYNYESLNGFRKTFIAASQSMYNNDTIVEWLTVYLIPHLDKVYDMIVKTKQGQKENDWKPRPLPVTLRPYPDNLN